MITYFLAQDPNAGDEVTLLVLDDPGMPAGMTSSGTTCIPRELAASNTSEPAMCKVSAAYIYIIYMGSISGLSGVYMVYLGSISGLSQVYLRSI